MNNSLVGSTTPPFLTLPVEIGAMILSYVDQKTLAIFEQVSKTVEPYVHETWRYHKLLAGFKFSWLACQHERFPEKWELLVTQTLIGCINFQTRVINRRVILSRTIPLPSSMYSDAYVEQFVYFKKIGKTYLQCEKIIERYPSLGAYIRLSLTETIDFHTKSIKKFEIDENQPWLADKMFQEFQKLPSSFKLYLSAYLVLHNNMIDFQAVSLQKGFESFAAVRKDVDQKKLISETSSEWGGERFLRAFIAIDRALPRETTNAEEGTQYLREALEKGVTCVSALAIHLLIRNPYKKTEEDKQRDIEWFEPLAILSAQQGDDSGLEALLQKYPEYSEALYQREPDYHFMPVLESLANKKLSLREWDEAESLYLQMIALQKSKGLTPHSSLLNEPAHIKFRAEKWEEAESLYEARLIDMRNTPVHAGDLFQILYHLTIIKVKLEKWTKAECFFIESSLLLLKMTQEAARTHKKTDAIHLFYKNMTEELSTKQLEQTFKGINQGFGEQKNPGEMPINKNIELEYCELLFHGLSIKIQLEKWEDASILHDSFYDHWEAHDEMGDDFIYSLIKPIANKNGMYRFDWAQTGLDYKHFLFYGLSKKVKLEKWEEAYPLYNALISEYEKLGINADQLPSHVNNLIDSIKDKINEIEQALCQPVNKRARHH